MEQTQRYGSIIMWPSYFRYERRRSRDAIEISDDSSDGMHDDLNENEAEPPEVNLGSYQSNRPMMSFVSDNNLSGAMDELLPEIPDIPAMARIADVNMEAVKNKGRRS
eukprot:20377_1